jgi:hypothetical protein
MKMNEKGDNSNIGAASRSNRFHSIYFAYFQIEDAETKKSWIKQDLGGVTTISFTKP